MQVLVQWKERENTDIYGAGSHGMEGEEEYRYSSSIRKERV